MRQESNMECEIAPLNSTTDCKGKRRDKKQRILRYLDEVPQNEHYDENASYFSPPPPPIDQQNFAEGFKTTDSYNDYQSDRFSPSFQMGYQADSFGLHSLKLEPSPNYSSHTLNGRSIKDEDLIPSERLNSLKLESYSNSDYSSPFSLNRRNIKDEPQHSPNSLVFHSASDHSLHSHPSYDYYNSSSQANYNFHEDSPHLQYQDQNDSYGGMSSDFQLGNTLHYNDYSLQDDLSYDEERAFGEDFIDEGPLDLSTSKRGDYPSPDVAYLRDYGSAGDFSLKEENNEENSWLKKIKTGTRSRVRSPKSWEFLLRLLMDPRSNPSMIKWEDERTGTFRLVQKDEIAKIWGMRSNKHKDGGLSYDNFARNLRYHYKTKMLVPVSEKHLVYRFSEEVMERMSSIIN